MKSIWDVFLFIGGLIWLTDAIVMTFSDWQPQKYVIIIAFAFLGIGLMLRAFSDE